MGETASRSRGAKPARSRYFIEAIERGLSLLALFDAENPTLTLAEIARRSGSIPSTALRLLHTLVDLDFLEELPESGRYRPSLAALKLGHAALVTSPLRAAAAPVLDRLQRQTGETVHLAVLIGGDALLLDVRAATDAFSIQFRPGNRFPAYCTAIGKALLSALPPEAMRATVSARGFEKLARNTIMSMKQLEAALRAVRDRGYAIQDEELAAGMRSVAAPVAGGDGAVAAAVGLVTATSRVALEQLTQKLAPVVVGTAAEISAKLRLAA